MKASKMLASAALACGLAGALPSYGADFDVTITNLTRGSYFTPLLVSAHPAENRLFRPGTAASANLQAMAEGGSIDGLVNDLDNLSATTSANPAGGLLGPADSTTTTLNTDAAPANTNLSVVAMILPSNDGFIGLNGITIPTEPGTYVFDVDAYDSGTEANDELRGSGASGERGFPFPGPVDTTSGFNGTGIPASAEGFVHIHRNVLGDTDINGGASDIDATVHRWLNPVARVTIVVR